MDKAEILEAIKRCAEEGGGVAVGKARSRSSQGSAKRSRRLFTSSTPTMPPAVRLCDRRRTRADRWWRSDAGNRDHRIEGVLSDPVVRQFESAGSAGSELSAAAVA